MTPVPADLAFLLAERPITDERAFTRMREIARGPDDSDRPADEAILRPRAATPDDYPTRAPQRTRPVESGSPADLVTLASVTPRRVSWLWPGYLPLGKLILLDGDAGLGKSTLALDLAARGSRGDTTPTGHPLDAFDTIYVTSEDDAADTIRPRLDVAGGDPLRVHVLSKLTLPDQADRLAAMVRQTRAKLIILDPLVGFLADGLRTNSDHDVRRALEPVARMAEELNIAVLGIRHLSKEGGRSALYRGGGSIAFGALARCVLARIHRSTSPEGRRKRRIRCPSELGRWRCEPPITPNRGAPD